MRRAPDFYNTGAATFEVEPDVAGGHIATINDSLYSTGATAVIAIDPAVTTLNLNTPVILLNGATVTSAVPTVNVAAGSGANDQYLVQGGLSLVGSGGAVNLVAGSTYGFSGEIKIGQSLTLNGNGAILDGSQRHRHQRGAADGNRWHDGGRDGRGQQPDAGKWQRGRIGGERQQRRRWPSRLRGKREPCAGDAQTIARSPATPPPITEAGIYNDGYYNGDANLTLNNCAITDNTAASTYGYGYGAGIANYGYNSGDATLTITGATTVSGNTGYYNGGIYNYSGTITNPIDRTIVYGQRCYRDGPDECRG